MKFYSKSTGGFYSLDIHGAEMPSDVVSVTDEQHAGLLAAQSSGKAIGWSGTAPAAISAPAETLVAAKARLSAEVDAEIASMYARFSRFEREYTQREAAARAFKAAGYAGDASAWVTAFATAAGKTPKDAADLIILQADAMYSALAALGALRMRKYEIAAAANVPNAQAIRDDIVARSAAAVAGL